MKLTYKFKIKKDNEQILEWFQTSKNLYNQANYLIKKELRENNKWIRYYELNKLMRLIFNLEGEINFLKLKSVLAQQTLILLDNNWKSYFKSIKDWKKNPNKYKGMPKPPNYLKEKEFILIFTNSGIQIIDNIIRLSKKVWINIPKYKDKDFSKFNQIRLLPKNNYIVVEIIYEEKIKNNNLNYNKYASIDLGLGNLVTLVSDKQPIIFSGKILKSYNQWYNKTKSKLVSIKDKMKINGYTNQLYKIEEDRNNFIKDYLHKVSKVIINYCIENKIGNLIVGKNNSWKDSINLGKKTNQKFVMIPHSRLVSYLKYKCELSGIKFIEHEESYTSKCDSLALEQVCKHETYLGKRIKRGLFQSSVGKIINADVNGALNILRKVIGDSDYINQIINSGLSFNPIKVRNVLSNPLQNLNKNLLVI